MSINRATPFVALATIVVAAVAMFQYGCSGSPTAATNTTVAISGVALSATSVVAGGSDQGTVSLTAAASTGGATISLSSSNPAVATVQTPVTIPAGSSSATFTVTAVAAGTATITASLNGSSSQSPTLTVTAGPTLSSISLSTPSVVGGNSVTGTATLTAAAPAGGAVVSLSGSDPVTVPPSVTVPAGSLSATFTILTRAVGGTVTGTINASYGGVSKSATLSVTKPTVATASFGVTGPGGTDTCTLANGGNTLDCTFNGSSSTAPGNINEWDWSYGVAGATPFAQIILGPTPTLTMPSFNCSLLPPPPLPAGVSSFTLIVKLKINDDVGNVSAEVTDSGARVLPNGLCGF